MGLKTNSTQMLSVTLIASLLMSGTAAFTTGAGLCDVPADVAALVATGAGTSMDWASADGGTGSVVAAAATVAAGEKALIKVMGTAVSGFLVHVNNAAGEKAGLFDEADKTTVPTPCGTGEPRHTLSHSEKLNADVTELMWTAPDAAGTYTVKAVVLEGQARDDQKWTVATATLEVTAAGNGGTSAGGDAATTMAPAGNGTATDSATTAFLGAAAAIVAGVASSF